MELHSQYLPSCRNDREQKEDLWIKPTYFKFKALLSAAMDAFAGVDLREQ